MARELSVIVASHDRPLRLRWLLNALEAQTLDRALWEVVVGHDSAGPETEELLTTHPLAQAGVLRHVRLEPGTGTPRRPAAEEVMAERAADDEADGDAAARASHLPDTAVSSRMPSSEQSNL